MRNLKNACIFAGVLFFSLACKGGYAQEIPFLDGRRILPLLPVQIQTVSPFVVNFESPDGRSQALPRPTTIIPMIIHPFQFTGISRMANSVSVPRYGILQNFNINIRPFIVRPLNIRAPEDITQTMIGSGVKVNSLYGIRFDDIYIANPDDQFNAKSYAKLSEQDLARFGVKGVVQSELEESLFPGTAAYFCDSAQKVRSQAGYLKAVKELRDFLQ